MGMSVSMRTLGQRIVTLAVVWWGMMPLATYAQNMNSTEQAIFAHLEARQTVFTIPVNTSSSQGLESEIKVAMARDPYLNLDVRKWSFTLTSIVMANSATIQVIYNESAAQYAAVVSGVHQVLKTIIKPRMDVYAKEKAIHDYVVLHTAYDTSLQNDSAYDALYKQSATCQGYAMLTYQLLKESKIPNLLISGTATNSQGTALHAWNEVDLNGKWYQLDTTWDDPVPNVPGQIMYNYFNLTTAQMARNHHWNAANLPVANTNYIQVLEASKSPQDHAILKSAALFVETAGDTFTNMRKLQTSLANLTSGHTYSFRIPYADTPQLSSLILPYQAQFSYVRDARDPSYAVVTMTMQ